MTLVSSYLLKNCCVVLIALAVSFGYLNVRIRMKIQEFRPNFAYEVWPTCYGGQTDLIRNFRHLGPILIYFKTTNNFEKNAELLMTKGFNLSNLYRSSTINICYGEQDCDTVDLRIFLREYFVEITSQPIFSKKIHKDIEIVRINDDSDTEPYYFLKRDSEWMSRPNFVDYAHRIQFEILGFMLGVAAATGTFIDIKFAPFFHCNQNETRDIFNLLDYLDLVDPDQYIIFKDIRRDQGKFYKFTSDPLKPFGYCEDESFGFNSCYSASNYPFYMAKIKLFVKPYVESKTLINNGLRHVFNPTYYNSKYSDSDSIDMELVFAEKSSASIDKLFYNWKDFSDFDNSTRIFWKAFFKFNREEKLKIYQIVTGLVNFPFGGFVRLPRTTIITSELGIFSRKFEIHLKENSTVSSIEEEIIFQLLS